MHVDGAPEPLRDVETIETELGLADLDTARATRGPRAPRGPYRRQGGGRGGRAAGRPVRARLLRPAGPDLRGARRPGRRLPGSAPAHREARALRRERRRGRAARGQRADPRARGAREGDGSRRDPDLREGRGRARRARPRGPRALPRGPGPRRIRPRSADPRRLPTARADHLPHGRPEGSPRLDDPPGRVRAAGGRRDPHRLRANVHSRRGDRLRRLTSPRGGEAGARAAGRMRVEGKEYVVQDGDVVHFRVGA